MKIKEEAILIAKNDAGISESHETLFYEAFQQFDYIYKYLTIFSLFEDEFSFHFRKVILIIINKLLIYLLIQIIRQVYDYRSNKVRY